MKGAEFCHWTVMSPPFGVTEKPSMKKSKGEVPATPVSLNTARQSMAAPAGTATKVASPASKQPGLEPAPLAVFDPSVTSVTMSAGNEDRNWWAWEKV